MKKTEFPVLRGELPVRLANRISEAISYALGEGMEVDEACCVAVAVIADYARKTYGNQYLPGLAAVLTAQAEKPLPKFEERVR